MPRVAAKMQIKFYGRHLNAIQTTVPSTGFGFSGFARQPHRTSCSPSSVGRVLESSATTDQKFWLARYLHQYGNDVEQKRATKLFKEIHGRATPNEQILDYALKDGALELFTGVVGRVQKGLFVRDQRSGWG